MKTTQDFVKEIIMATIKQDEESRNNVWREYIDQVSVQVLTPQEPKSDNVAKEE